MSTPPPIDFLLITALPEERDAVLQRLPGYQMARPAAGDASVYYRATLPATYSDGTRTSYELVVTFPPEMSRAPAAALAATAIARWQPSYVLLVGIAGGIGTNGVALGDLLIANRIIDYEVAKAQSEALSRRWHSYDVHAGLLQRAMAFTGWRWHGPVAAARPEPGRPERHFGPIASGDKVVEDPSLLNDLLQTWPKLIGVEMEAGGVAPAARQSNPPPGFFMVRAASDLADPDKGSPEVRGWRPYACAVAAAFAVAFLRSGPVVPRRDSATNEAASPMSATARSAAAPAAPVPAIGVDSLASDEARGHRDKPGSEPNLETSATRIGAGNDAAATASGKGGSAARDDQGATPGRALIVTALPLEASAVRAHLGEMRQERHSWGFSTRGVAAGWEIMLVISGRYNERAADVTAHAVRDFDPTVALFVGVAGGLKDVGHGDVVVAESVILYQAGKQEDQRFYPRAPIEPTDARLLDLARHFAAGAIDKAWAGAGTSRIVVEPIVSGDVVLASTSHADYYALREGFSQAVAIEQEGFGFLSALRRTPSVRGAVIRGISDLLADKALAPVDLSEGERGRHQAEDDERQREAARHAAAFAFALLTALDSEQDGGVVPGQPTRPAGPAMPSARREPLARSQSSSSPTARSAARLITSAALLPGSRIWQDAEARADAWSDQHFQRRDLPVPLPPKPWLALHLVPFQPLAPAADVARLREVALPHLPPLGQLGNFGAEERDGSLLALPLRAQGGVPAGYSMILPTGQVEGAMAMVRGGVGERPIGLRRLERVIAEAGRDYTEALRALGVPPPIRFRFALILEGGEVLCDEFDPAAATTVFSPVRLIRILHETLDDWNIELPGLLQPQFDQLWREAGYPGGSASFDAQGRWQPLPTEEER